MPGARRTDSELAGFGLSPPALRIEVVDISGDKHAVELGRSLSDVWFAKREGDLDGSIAVLETESAMRLTVPFELLLDRRLMRAPRAALERILLLGEEDAPRLELARESLAGKDRWRVTAGTPQGFLADELLASELVGRLERSLFADALVSSRWDEREVRGAFVFEGAGETWRVDVGPDGVEDSGELRGPHVRRGGEETVFLGAPELLELLATDPLSLRDLQLTAIDELTVSGIEVVGPDGAQRGYERSERGRWTLAGDEGGAEAFELLGVLDALLALRAEGFVDESRFPEPAQVTVRILRADGGATELDLATVGEGEGALTLARVPGIGAAALAPCRADVAERVARLLAAAGAPR